MAKRKSRATSRDATIKMIINNKMRCFDDFGICSYDDKEMREKFREAIDARPTVDPQIALDSYCKPFIEKTIFGWN